MGIIFLVLLIVPVQGAMSLTFGREILALYKSSDNQTEAENEVFFYLSRPLKQLGFTVRYWDIDRGIPNSRTMRNVRAVVSWYRGAAMANPERYLEFLEGSMDEGIKVVVFDNFGAYQNRNTRKYLEPNRINFTLSRLGILYFGDWTEDSGVLRIVSKDSQMVEYQGKQDLDSASFFYRFIPHDRNLKVYLSVARSDRGYDPSPLIVTNRNGGFALSRYIYRMEGGKVKLLLNVKSFLEQALFPQAEREKIALLADTSQNLTSKTLAYIEALLRRAKLPFEVIKKEDLSLLLPRDLRRFTAAGLILTDDSGLDPAVLQDLLDRGGGVVSLVGGKFDKLAAVLGKVKGGASVTGRGYRFSKSFVFAEGVSLEEPDFNWQSAAGRPTGEAEVLGRSYRENLPLVWTVPRGNGQVLTWNWDGFATGAYQGFILESFLRVRPVGAAVTAGLGIMFIDDWPLPMFNVVKPPPGIKDTEFYVKRFWPDMKKFFSARDIPYISYLVFNYNATVEPPFSGGEFFMAENLETLAVAREILASGQELGFHGYNHISLTAEKTSVNVAAWPSQDIMEESLEAGKREWISLFGEHTLPYAYIAPNNIISEEGIEAIHNVFPSIKVMSFVRSGSEDETGSEFGPHPTLKDVYLIPRTSSGYPFTPEVKQLAVTSVAGAGVWSHFIHPDDVYDPYRSKGLNWEQLKREFSKTIDFVTKNYPWLRFVTIREAHETLQRHDDTGIELQWQEGNRLIIHSTAAGLPLRIRMNGYRLKRSEGVNVLYRYKKIPAIVIETEDPVATLEFARL